jgi:hypothetical protein
MIHGELADLLDELAGSPDELFISSNSKHCALYSTADGAYLFLHGDFSGTPEECEAEVRRIMNDVNADKQVLTT